MKQTICLYQAFRAKVIHIKEGCGDCSKCITNEDNKNCVDYLPITLWTFQAEGFSGDYRLVVKGDQK